MAKIQRMEKEEGEYKLINKNFRLPHRWYVFLQKTVREQAAQGKVGSVSDLVRMAIYEKWIKPGI